MAKHFFKRFITVIVAFFTLSLVFNIFIYIKEGDPSADTASIAMAYQAVVSILVAIVVVVLGLILDSIILYVKKKEDKAKGSLLVLFIFLLFMFGLFRALF